MQKKSINKKFYQIYQDLFQYYGAQNWWPAKTRLEMILGAILTQNTAWSNVIRAIKNLKSARVLNVKSLIALKQSELTQLIRPAGYFNVKAVRIKNFLDFLIKKYSGSLNKMCKQPVEYLRSQLLLINGLGNETADCILLYALAKPVFVVDGYTRRIFFCQGLIEESAAYEKIQEKFTVNIPHQLNIYNEYHALIVVLGKNFCRGRNPRCANCPLLKGKKQERYVI